MIKLAHAYSHTEMCTSIFGGTGYGRKWSYGYKFFIRHLNKKYRNLLNPNGLKRWIPMFPAFAESIRKKNHTRSCLCGCRNWGNIPNSWFRFR